MPNQYMVYGAFGLLLGGYLCAYGGLCGHWFDMSIRQRLQTWTGLILGCGLAGVLLRGLEVLALGK